MSTSMTVFCGQLPRTELFGPLALRGVERAGLQNGTAAPWATGAPVVPRAWLRRPAADPVAPSRADRGADRTRTWISVAPHDAEQRGIMNARGYLARQRSFTPNALDVDLAGKTYIVTGANSGLGRSTALALASRGGSVHMLCRDRGRGEKAKAQVQSAATNPDCVHLHICDLASLEDIRAFVERWSGGDGSPRKLDCLVNNAGLMAFTRMDTVDGVELNFGVNVLGTYVLTELLLPCLKAADSPRVVTVSSAGMLLAGREALRESTCTGDDLLTVRRPGGPVPDAQAERGIDGQQQYSRNKRCQVALTEHWAATHAGVRFWVMHPGWASTDGLAKAMPEFHSTFKSSLRTEEQGADTILWLSIAEEALKHKDATFFLDRQSQPKHLWFAGTGYGDEDVAGLVSLLNRLARGAGGCEAKQ